MSPPSLIIQVPACLVLIARENLQGFIFPFLYKCFLQLYKAEQCIQMKDQFVRSNGYAWICCLKLFKIFFVNWNDLQFVICYINYELHGFFYSTKMKNADNCSILFLNNLLYSKYMQYIEASFHCVLLWVKDLGLQKETLAVPNFTDPPGM